MYDEVEEDVYRSVVRGRLMEDDFIEEDDGVSGYADNGMDDWDRSASEHDDDDDDEKGALTLFIGGNLKLTLPFRYRTTERGEEGCQGEEGEAAQGRCEEASKGSCRGCGGREPLHQPEPAEAGFAAEGAGGRLHGQSAR